MSNHPDVLDEILHRHQNADYDYNTTDAKQAILSHYRSVEEIEAALPKEKIIREGFDDLDAVSTINKLMKKGYNQALADVRKALRLEG